MALAVLAVAAGCSSAVKPAAATPTAPAEPLLTFHTADGRRAGVAVKVEATRPQREQGLMGRTSLDDAHGMLFVWPVDTTTPFWMKDTPIPLSVGFISADGRLLDVQDMQPYSLDLHAPPPGMVYRYALEVAQGWFQRHGIRPGDQADTAPFAAAAAAAEP